MATNSYQRPRGTADVTPRDIHKWHHVERILTETARLFGFAEIRFPTFEHTELFLRSVGTDTDVVQKEIYTFEDKGGRSISLRPEGTASVVRSYIENSLHTLPAPQRFFYIAPCFRYEKPQAGRFREHHQFGAEMFGSALPQADAEIISFAYSCLERLGIRNIALTINSIGCRKCRPAYYAALREYLDQHKDKLCETCLSRLERNPMRILDCKNETCAEVARGAPKAVDMLCGECREHFDGVCAALDGMGIRWTLDTDIVRGLDYYTRTVFEFKSDIGAVCGGGRYDKLVEELGGQETCALGFGMGVERLIYAVEQNGAGCGSPGSADLFIVSADDAGAALTGKLAFELRQRGISVLTDLCGRSVKAQMKTADKTGAAMSAVIGQSEISAGRITIKNMKTGATMECGIGPDEIAGAVRRA